MNNENQGQPVRRPAPPKDIPAELRTGFLMDGRARLLSMYRNDNLLRARKLTAAMYAETARALDEGSFRYYGPTLGWLLDAVRDHPLTALDVCVFGSVRVNCDLIALRAGAKHVDILEYNPPECEHPDVGSRSLASALEEDRQWDAGLSISSFEHDGLGRYGDPLDPDGDLRAMREADSLLRADALLYLAVPVGVDCLVWNAHRIYGPARLPKLLASWSVVASYGFSESLFELPAGEFKQPVFVLCKAHQLTQGDEATTNTA
jgi:hypothetical protein